MKAFAYLALIGLLAGCGGVAATPSPTPHATDAESLLVEWYTNGPIATTCADWNGMTATDQTALVVSMVATIRSLDPGSSKAPATDAQVSLLHTALVGACTAGSDCTDPDLFCDTDRITFAAYAEFAANLEEMRK